MSSKAIELQSKANPQQVEAILATDGPVLIITTPAPAKPSYWSSGSFTS